MDFIPLQHLNQFTEIDSGVSLIFKHSTRCSISSMALNRLKSCADLKGAKSYYLDLLKFREISNEIASRYGVQHESPQILILREGKCEFHTSHNDISCSVISNEMKRLSAANLTN